MKEKQIKLESIGNGVKIYTSREHSFGTDAVLLANFAAPQKSDTAIDLGSGCGIIPFLWSRYDSPAKITALEIQQSGVELIQKSIAFNHANERITAIQGDLRKVEQYISPLHCFTLVTMNPPYFAMNSGYRNEVKSHEQARHEVTCTTDDFFTCVDKLLRYGGRVCLCQKPERLADIICSMREHGIEPKRMRFVSGKAGKDPYLVLIEGRKGSGKQLQVMHELNVQNENGTFSEEMIKIYGDYGDGTKI